MTVFDVIRYPVTDIFDPKQIDHIPLTILIPWLRECVKFINWPEAVNYYLVRSFAEFIEFIITRKSVAVTNSIHDDKFIHSFKTYFTHTLKKSISEYNSNL